VSAGGIEVVVIVVSVTIRSLDFEEGAEVAFFIELLNVKVCEVLVVKFLRGV
jgi:hypothetical protein